MKRIESKNDMIHFLASDQSRLTSPVTIKDRLLGTEKYYIWKYIKCLRKTEYILNCRKGLIGKIQYAIQLRRLLRIQRKTQLFVPVNVFGPGLYIPHLGRILVSPIAEIGKNCTIRPGVLIGANLGGVSKTEVHKTIIGENVEIAEGCKILCRKIGNNVKFAPNTVVLRNVPENSVVYGNPCEIMPNDV